MGKPKRLPDYAYVESRLTYDPVTGDFYWKPRAEINRFMVTWNKNFAGKKAGRGGGDKKGAVDYQPIYLSICIDLVRHYNHRLAWLMMTGEDPYPLDVDHFNRDKHDNRWNNLRLATPSQNRWNEDIRCNNTSGVKGVSWRKDSQDWHGQICTGYNHQHLGNYRTRDEAERAVMLARQAQHGEFAFPCNNITEPPERIERKLSVTGFRHVYLDKRSGKFYIHYKENGQNVYCGRFLTAQEAADILAGMR